MSNSTHPHRPQTSFHTPPVYPALRRKRSPSPSPSLPRHTIHSGPRPPTNILTHLTTHNLSTPPLPPVTLRQRHLATLTTLLHHSLSTSDYPRALRAYGLLLRTPTTDIRAFWHLGVHLLLRVGRPEAAIELMSRLVHLYPYHRGTHSAHGNGSERARMIRPSVLEFVPGLLETLVLVGEGEGGEGRARVWERVEEWMVAPPWAEMREMWLWRGCVAAWCAQGEGVGAGERARWRAEAERAWKGYEERGGEVPDVVRWEEDGDEDEEDGEDEEEVVVVDNDDGEK